MSQNPSDSTAVGRTVSVRGREGARWRIWLVDDSPLQLERARALLLKRFDLECFADGERLLERLAEGSVPDVILLDWQLPGVSGLEVCRFVRERHDELALPILMLTTRDAGEDLAEGLAAGANDYLTKPYDDLELLARLESLVRLRQQAALLHAREQFHSTTLRSIGDAVIATDAAGRVTFANAVAESLTGWSATEAEGRPLAEIFHVLDAGTRASVPVAVERVMADGAGAPRNAPVLLRRKCGVELPIEDTISPVRDERGVPTGAVLVFRDVSEKRRLEAEREALFEREQQARADALESGERLRRVLDALVAQPSLSVRVLGGPEFVVERANAVYTQDVLGGREVLGRRLAEVVPEAREEIPLLERARATGGAVFGQERPILISRPGAGATEERLFDSVYQPVLGSDGEVESILALSLEVTEVVRARRTADRRVRQEQERSDFEQQLIGIVSHDLRNPVSAITLSAESLARAGGLSDRQQKQVARIHASSDRAHRMIRDLLDFTSARLAGGLRIARQPSDLHELVDTVLDEVRQTHGDREIRSIRRDDGRGNWDPDRIAQVVQNLVTNALKYSPADTPVRVETWAEGDSLLLSVHNQGAPIARERLGRLFHPLQRATDDVDRTGRSIGLGLYIVKQVLEAHGGTIAVDSSPEAGTTFTVRLPRT